MTTRKKIATKKKATKSTKKTTAAKPKPRAPKKQAAASAPPPSEKANFNRGMLMWMKSREFKIGLTGEGIKEGKDAEVANETIDFLKDAIGTMMPMVAGSGVDSETLFNAMVPLLPLADLIGFKTVLGGPILFMVIYADDIPAPEVMERFVKIFQLAEPFANFGLRLNGRGTGVVAVFPLVVYFNAQTFKNEVGILSPLGYTREFMHQAVVDPIYVNVEERTVVARQDVGLLEGLAHKVTEAIAGLKYPIFDESDLQSVLTIAATPASVT